MDNQDYRPMKGRARFAIAAIAIFTGFQIFLSVSLLAQALVIGMPIEAAPPEDAATNVVAMGMCCAGLGVLAGLVAAAATFLTWLHRACANAGARGHDLSFTPGEAVIAWFIPFVNLVRPYAIVGELDRATSNSERDDLSLITATDIKIWWGLWIGGGVIGWVSQVESLGLTVTALFDSFSSLISLISAILVIRIVKRITDRLEGTEPKPVEF